MFWSFLAGMAAGAMTAGWVSLCMLSAASRGRLSPKPPHLRARRLPLLKAHVMGNEIGGAVILQPRFCGQRAAPPRFLQ